MSIMQDETGEWHDDGADVGNPISPPKVIWAYPNGCYGEQKLGWQNAQRYHHDSIVRELREALEGLLKNRGQAYAPIMRAHAALAKLER